MHRAPAEAQIQTLRVKTINAATLNVARVKKAKHCVPLRYDVRKKIHAIRHELHELHTELHHIEKELHHQEEQLRALQREVRALKAELASGLPANPALQSYFTSRQGQTVTIATSGGSITGTVTVVGTNAVELIESTGDIVVIPYAKINAVQ